VCERVQGAVGGKFAVGKVVEEVIKMMRIGKKIGGQKIGKNKARKFKNQRVAGNKKAVSFIQEYGRNKNEIVEGAQLLLQILSEGEAPNRRQDLLRLHLQQPSDLR